MKNIVPPIATGATLLLVGGFATNSLINGEQLIIKFLATVVVAALGLYIISDFRLRKSKRSAFSSDQSPPIDTIQQTESGQPTMPLFRSRVAKESAPSSPPPNSTAAFMSNMNQGAKRTATTPDDRKYSAMGRVNQNRRSDSTDIEQLAETSPINSEDPSESGGSTLASTMLDTPERDLDLDETTLNAPPLETLNLEPKRSQPDQRNPADTVTPEIHSLEGVGEDSTSILLVPNHHDSQDIDDSVSWSVVGKPTEIDDFPSTEFDVDDDEVEDTNVEDTSIEEIEIDDSEHSLASGPQETVDDIVNDTSDTTIPEQRCFGSKDIDITDLRPVELEAIPDIQSPEDDATPTSSTSEFQADTAELSTINEAIADGEKTIINSLIDSGVLSSEGALTDDDISTMIYVAFTSSELRKILQDGGTMDTKNGEINLDGLGIYTTKELEKDDQFVVVGPDETISELRTKAGI